MKKMAIFLIILSSCAPVQRTEIIGGESKASRALLEETPRQMYIESSPKEPQYIIILGE